MSQRNVDNSCFDLAESWLSEEAHTEEEVMDLARAIQKAIEDWFAYDRRRPA